MLKLADLARRADFTAGPLRVSPGRRLVEGPGGKASVEPIVMKVFLLLIDAAGNVVTRDELFGNAWGGVFVGDDSLNRAIARVRRIASDTAPGLFEIETIPRTGYRLTGPIVDQLDAPANADQRGTRPSSGVPRRWLLAGGATTAALLGTGGMWMYRSRQTDPRSAALAEKADQVLRFDFPGADKQAVQLLREAVAIDRRNARAWGLLAFAVAAGSEGDPTSQTPDEMAQIEDAIRSAQRIEPNESNALLARFMVQRSLRDWIPTDTNLRSLLRLDPDNIFAIERLMGMLQAAGLNEESRQWNERQIALDPLSPGPQFRRALKFWISGHIPEADMAADQATQKWPAHPLVWNARFNIYAFTNRAGAALAMLNDEDSRPKTLSPLAVQTWRVSLEALEARTPKLIAAARDANLAAARQAPALAAYGVMILSGLGEVDAAYEIASGFLLGRGPVIVRKEDIGGNFTRSPGWRMTQWLFTPPVAALRSDGRFGSLCDGIGVSAYWRWRGVRPDYLRTPS